MKKLLNLVAAPLLAVVGFAAATEAEELVTLTNGTGNGRAIITVDGFGSFGSTIGGTGAAYDPAGPVGRSSAVYTSALYFSGEGFLNALPRVPVTQRSPTTASSTFRPGDRFDVTLTQRLLPASPSGSTLEQTYTIKNLTGAPEELTVVRLMDGDLTFSGSVFDDFGGVSGDLTRVFQYEAGSGSGATFVGMEMIGGLPSGFSVQRSGSNADAVILAGGVPGGWNYRIYNDANGNRLTDSGGDTALMLQNTFTIQPGRSAALTTRTIFGAGSQSRDRELSGSIVKNGLTPDGVAFVLRQGDSPARSATTDDDGRYEFLNPVPGVQFTITGRTD